MKKTGALIQFDPRVLASVDQYAKAAGVSRNAAVNLACSTLVSEADRLREESRRLLQEADRLRQLVVKVAIAKGGVDVGL